MRRLVAALSAARRNADDSGLTLIETVVSLTVFALIASGLVATAIVSVAAERSSKSYQTATRIGEQAIETARGAGYSNLVMKTSSIVSDSTITSSCSGGHPSGFSGGHYFTPDGLSCEGIVESASGSILFQPTSPNSGYSVKVWVTCVDASTTAGCQANDLKRVTVRVSWTSGSATKTYKAMTMVSPVTQSAVSAHSVAVTSATSSASANPTATSSQTAVFQVLVTNTGDTDDTFNVTVTKPSTGTGSTWTTAVYQDSYQDGAIQPYPNGSAATALADSNGDGTPDTGVLKSSATTCSAYVATTSCTYVLVAVTIPAGTAATAAIPFVVTGTSTTTAASTSSTTLNVTSGGSTPTNYVLYFHNSTTPGNSVATLNMPMDTNAPTNTVSSYNYSCTSVTNGVCSAGTNVAGRQLTHTNQGTAASTAATMADWVYGTWPTSTTLKGTATGTLWVQGCAGSTTYAVYLGMTTSGLDGASTNWISGATSGNVTVATPTPSTSCTGNAVTAVTFNIPISTAVTFGQREVLELKVVASGSKDAVINYDNTATVSSITLPQVAT